MASLPSPMEEQSAADDPATIIASLRQQVAQLTAINADLHKRLCLLERKGLPEDWNEETEEDSSETLSDDSCVTVNSSASAKRKKNRKGGQAKSAKKSPATPPSSPKSTPTNFGPSTPAPSATAAVTKPSADSAARTPPSNISAPATSITASSQSDITSANENSATSKVSTAMRQHAPGPSRPAHGTSKAANSAHSTSATRATRPNLVEPKPRQEAPKAVATKKPNLPPPLILRDLSRWRNINAHCQSNGIALDEVKKINNGAHLKIVPKTPADFRRLSDHLFQMNYAFHTFQLAEDINLRVVIKNLGDETTVEEIIEDLTKKGFPVISVTRMTNRNEILDMFLVQLTKNEEAKKIFDTKYVCGVAVKIEAKKRNGEITQCHRCQMYGHGASRCNAPYICVKCAGPHPSTECTRDKNTPATCALCEGPHPASYRGCKLAPKAPKKKTEKTPKVQQEAPSKDDINFPQLPAKKQPTPQPATSTNIDEQISNLIDHLQNLNASPQTIAKALAAITGSAWTNGR